MILRFKSILSRIVFLHILVIGFAAIVLSTAVYLLLSGTATGLQNQTLRDHEVIIAQYLTLSPEGQWDLELPSDLAALYAHSYNGFAFSVVDESGKVLFSSLADHASIFPSDSRGVVPTYFQSSYLHGAQDAPVYYGGSIPERRDGHTAWIQIAQNLEHPDVIIDDIVARFFYRVGWIVIPILLLLFAVDVVIVRRAIRPILEASESARAIEPSRLGARLPTSNMPSEILPLIDAINNALDRLEKGFRIQRDFTADAAHELRTPLTLLRTRIDTLPDRKIAGELRSDIEGMSRLVNQLLEIAELEGFAVGPNERIDLQDIASGVVAFMAPLALAQNKNIALTGEEVPVWIRGNSDAVFQAIRNVVENAIRHTALETTVEVEIGKRGSVRILDRGSGIPEKDRELIFRRFWRRDRRRSGSTGLGLAIVSRIIEAHTGKIIVENRADGGAAVALNFILARKA
jgi:signal transduction histidine kinase